jgi:CheY-like chemotaxis protein
LVAVWGTGAPDNPDRVLAADQKPLRVLVVDDEILHRQGHQRILQKYGHTVTLAEDGEQALAAVSREPFDLILLDIRMPRMNGLQVAAKIRALALPFEQPRIIALTGNPPREENELRTWRSSGIDRWLEKSLDEAKLFSAIADALRPRADHHGAEGT